MKVLRSFTYAFRGLIVAIRSELNLKIHLTVAIAVIIAGICFSINRVDWVIIIFAIGIVIAAELFNTAIEELADLVHPERNAKVGAIKDIAASATLVLALSAAVIGVLVFSQYIFA